MKISTQSWHYKLLHFLDLSKPDNLCPYFCKVLFGVGLLIAIIVVVISWAYAMFVLPFHAELWNISLVIWSFNVMFIALVLKCDAAYDSIWIKEIHVVPEFPEYSFVAVFKAWLKAKHDKVCPQIDFK